MLAMGVTVGQVVWPTTADWSQSATNTSKSSEIKIKDLELSSEN